MSASLVGSEMCIRDRGTVRRRIGQRPRWRHAPQRCVGAHLGEEPLCVGVLVKLVQEHVVARADGG
eukprot:10078465-Alexandrium_andersonii.AAC.1